MISHSPTYIFTTYDTPFASMHWESGRKRLFSEAAAGIRQSQERSNRILLSPKTAPKGANGWVQLGAFYPLFVENSETNRPKAYVPEGPPFLLLGMG